METLLTASFSLDLGFAKYPRVTLQMRILSGGGNTQAVGFKKVACEWVFTCVRKVHFAPGSILCLNGVTEETACPVYFGSGDL